MDQPTIIETYGKVVALLKNLGLYVDAEIKTKDDKVNIVIKADNLPR